MSRLLQLDTALVQQRCFMAEIGVDDGGLPTDSPGTWHHVSARWRLMLVSLVIGTRNRVDKLTNCLDAVAAATRPDCAVEVIVADNGSADSTRQVVEDFITRSPVKARYVYSPGPRISVAMRRASD